VVLGDGEHHNAADAALDFLGNCGRIHSLRLHPHAETDKKATNRNLSNLVLGSIPREVQSDGIPGDAIHAPRGD
jgi:hypothetical protein